MSGAQNVHGKDADNTPLVEFGIHAPSVGGKSGCNKRWCKLHLEDASPAAKLDFDRRLRAVLKKLLRAYGMRCTRIEWDNG
jgi:hypothetical protein